MSGPSREVSIRLESGEGPRYRSCREMSPHEAPARAPRKLNAIWTLVDDELLIRLLSRPTISWDTISGELDARRLAGGEKTPSVCQSRLKRVSLALVFRIDTSRNVTKFKTQFRVVSALKQAPGLYYDDEFGCRDASKMAWTKYVKVSDISQPDLDFAHMPLSATSRGSSFP